MRKILLTMGMLLLSFAAFFLLFRYNMESIERDSIQSAMEQSADSAFIASYDASSRMQDEKLTINSTMQYEQNFKDYFNKTVKVNLSNKNVSFDFKYLVTKVGVGDSMQSRSYVIKDGEYIKGILNEIKVNESVYELRLIVDQKE